MSIRYFSLPGYVHLYRSLLRFCKLSLNDAAELTYWLNAANLDSVRMTNPDVELSELTPFRFNRRLNGSERPYRTEVQLYRALEALDRNIIFAAITSQQREAVRYMRYLMRELELSFVKVFGMEIDDPRTVYESCASRLIPDEDEPSVCMFEEWLLLPTA